MVLYKGSMGGVVSLCGEGKTPSVDAHEVHCASEDLPCPPACSRPNDVDQVFYDAINLLQASHHTAWKLFGEQDRFKRYLRATHIQKE